MDYLVIEGYKTAAEEFSREAELSPPVDLQSIEDRTIIREALQRGDVEEAITRVNELDPEVRHNSDLLVLLYPDELFSCTILRHSCLFDESHSPLQSSI